MKYPAVSWASYSKLSDAAGVVNIPPNPHRFAIFISPVAGRTVVVGIGSSGPSPDGLQLVSSAEPMEFTCERHGDGIKGNIRVTDSAGVQQTIGWSEGVECLYTQDDFRKRDVRPLVRADDLIRD